MISEATSISIWIYLSNIKTESDSQVTIISISVKIVMSK